MKITSANVHGGTLAFAGLICMLAIVSPQSLPIFAGVVTVYVTGNALLVIALLWAIETTPDSEETLGPIKASLSDYASFMTAFALILTLAVTGDISSSH